MQSLSGIPPEANNQIAALSECGVEANVRGHSEEGTSVCKQKNGNSGHRTNEKQSTDDFVEDDTGSMPWYREVRDNQRYI